jgi:cyclic pyranopterin phosphate synthase
MPDGGIKFLPKELLLTTDEIRRLITVFRSLGVMKVRLTGGEPLLRPDVEQIIGHIYESGVQDVSLTTNGILLKEQLGSLQRSGLRRINISLDTFQRDVFQKITGADAYEKVFAGVMAAIHSELSPVKINVVVMREWNLAEVPAFVRFAESFPVEVRFLELMPTRNTFEGTALVDKSSFVSVDEIRSRVEAVAQLESEDPIGGVARTFGIKGGVGKIGFVSPVSNHFCGSCNRVRLTSTGGLKTCLHGADVVDLRTGLRTGLTNEDIAMLIRNALMIKPAEHLIRPDQYTSRYLQMSQVGG